MRDKAFKIASDPNYYDYERVLGSMVYKFFYKGIQQRNQVFIFICCYLFIFLVNMHGLFLWKTKEEVVTLMHFKKQPEKDANQTKSGSR